ncbi:NHL repeat containing protein, partial [Parafrankia sp. EUN1f]
AGGRVDVVAGGAGGRVDVVAGTGAPGTSGDHGPARLARLRRPSAVTVAADGRILIADTDNDRLRAVSPDGHITTVAGAAYDPRQRRLPRPGAVAVCNDGRIAVSCAGVAGLLELRPTGRGSDGGSDGAELVPVDPVAIDPVGAAVAGVAYLPRGALLSVRPGTGLIRVLEPDGRQGTLAAARRPEAATSTTGPPVQTAAQARP